MSLALIFQPPHRLEFQLLLEHLPFQLWEYPVLSLLQISEQMFSLCWSRGSLLHPWPQLGIQPPHSKSLLMSLLCSLSIPCASTVTELTTLSCNCVLNSLSPHSKLKAPPGLGLCCLYHCNLNIPSDSWHLIGVQEMLEEWTHVGWPTIVSNSNLKLNHPTQTTSPSLMSPFLSPIHCSSRHLILQNHFLLLALHPL